MLNPNSNIKLSQKLDYSAHPRSFVQERNQVRIQPAGGSGNVYTAGTRIVFDLPAVDFLDTTTTYLSVNAKTTSGGTHTLLRTWANAWQWCERIRISNSKTGTVLEDLDNVPLITAFLANYVHGTTYNNSSGAIVAGECALLDTTVATANATDTLTQQNQN